MNKYQFQILRYVHDQVTGEFVNVGLVLYSPETKFLKAKFVSKYSRLSQFFLEINGSYLLKLFKSLEKGLNTFYTNDEINFKTENLESITSYFLAKDDGSLQFSEVKTGIVPKLLTESEKLFDHTLENLYVRFVAKYIEEKEERKDDSYVWKKLYKQYFDELEITKDLQKHTVKTSNDLIDFDIAWKNGVWHCYQPLSFDLKNPEKIKHKAYQWESILRELDSSKEEIKLFILSSLPKDRPDLKKFIKSKLEEIELKNIKVNLVEEKDAPELASNVKKEMAASSVN